MKNKSSTLSIRILLLSVAVLAATGFLLKPVDVKVNAVEEAYVSLKIDEKDLAYGTMFLDRDDPTINDDMVLTHASQNQRTIVGFTPDASSNIASINRLNLEITYNVYSEADVFKWWPKEETISATVYANKNYKIMSSNLTDEFRHVLPRVGRVEDELIELDEITKANGALIITNPFKAWYQNKATNLEEAGLLDQEFYVIMPVSEDLKRVWISIDGYTTNGDVVTDGTNAGSYFQDSIGKYITIPFGMPRLVYFPKQTEVFKIVVTNAIKITPDASVQLDFGPFNTEQQKVLNPYQSFWIGNNGTYDYQATVAQFDEMMIYYSDARMDVRLYYVSDGVPMYSNIIDSDGNLQPDDETPTPCDIVCQLNKTLAEAKSFFEKAWAMIQLFGAIALVIVFILGGIWVVDKLTSIRRNTQ